MELITITAGYAAIGAVWLWYEKSGRGGRARAKRYYEERRAERTRVVNELRAQGYEFKKVEEETPSTEGAESDGKVATATATRIDVATSPIAAVMLEGMPVVSQERRELADYIRDELRKDPEGVFLAQTDGYLAADALDGFNDAGRPERAPPA